jgi:ribosomal protein L37E
VGGRLRRQSLGNLTRVFFIFGWGWKATHLSTTHLTCQRCGNHVAHPVQKEVLKVSLFFVPLIPLKTRYTVTCTACGLTSETSRAAAGVH